MKKIFAALFILFFTFLSLHARYIDVISDFDIDSIPTDWQFLKERGFEVRALKMRYDLYFSNYYNQSDVDKIIIMNDIYPKKYISKIPKEKLILILWEPFPIDKKSTQLYETVFTFHDKYAGHENFKKFYYPYLQPMKVELFPFHERKLATLITGNWTDERVRVVKYYEKQKGSDFDFYSRKPGKMGASRLFKKKIPGSHSGNEKIETLRRYKFCYCFENCEKEGYITEKIFSCFAAGCVPIYLGAQNMEDFVPKNCFISFRDFKNLDQLNKYLREMPESIFLKYIDNAHRFLNSEKAKLFSPEYFERLIDEAIH